MNFVFHLSSLRRRKGPKAASISATIGSDSPEKIEDYDSSGSTIDGELVTTSVGKEECCSVCLLRLTEGDDERRRLPCFHEFHKVCVDRWLDLFHKACPLCRFSVEVGESTQIKEELTEEMVIWFSSFHAAGF